MRAPRRVAKDDLYPEARKDIIDESGNVGVCDEAMRRDASCVVCCARVGECGRGRASSVDRPHAP